MSIGAARTIRASVLDSHIVWLYDEFGFSRNLAEEREPVSVSPLNSDAGLTETAVFSEIAGEPGNLFTKQGANNRPVVKIGENRFVIVLGNSRQELVLVTSATGQVEFLHGGGSS